MNRYGLMAQQHWAQWLPSRYAAIADPDSFFSDLGNQVAARIDTLALQLAGDDGPGEGYLGKAGRLGQARHQAQEIVLAEMVLLEPEPVADNGWIKQKSLHPKPQLTRSTSAPPPRMTWHRPAR
jgi:hypothetical protein